jgi:hypothetical protein
MTMPPRWRKFVLTLHIVTSVGWIGALAAYLVLDIAATSGGDVAMVRAAYGAMEMVARYAIVPLAFAALLIGILNALGTPWGLFRHYWVAMSLVLTVFATAVLMSEIRTIGYLAETAAGIADPRTLPGTLVHSVGGLLVLLVIMTLSIYKPRGMTRYGWRKQQQERQAAP